VLNTPLIISTELEYVDLLKDYRTCLDVRADAGWDDLRNDLYESVVLRGEEMVIEVE